MSILTIALCTYNREKFLGDAIEGILSQTYNDFNLIIYDNASTDGTESLVKSFKDSRITYLRFSENVGMSGNWLRSIRDCKTKYLSIAHDDDIMEPTLIEHEIQIMESDAEILLVSCKSQYVNESNEILEGKCNSTFTEDVIYEKYGFHEAMYNYKGANFISAPSAMIRSSILPAIDYGFFNYTGSVADCYWYLKINEYGKIYLMHDALLRYRIHGGQYSDNRLSQIKEHDTHIIPLLEAYLGSKKAGEIREAYQKEILALEFIKTITVDIEQIYQGYYLQNGVHIDEDLFARIKYLNHLARGNEKNYIIWGASIAGYKNMEIFRELLPNFKLKGFVDRSKKGEFEGLPVYNPHEYDFKSGNYIVVCTSTGAYEIKNFLEEKGLVFMDDFIIGNVSR